MSADSGGGPSNADVHAANLHKLQQWLEKTSAIPERRGKANITAIGLAANVDRQVLYHPKAKAMIAVAVARVQLGLPDQQRAPGVDATPAWVSQRIKELEEALAVSRAEAREVRERLRRYEHLERHVAETGMYPR